MNKLVIALIMVCATSACMAGRPPAAEKQAEVLADVDRHARMEEQLRHTEEELLRTQRTAVIAGAVTAGLRCLLDLVLIGGLVAAVTIAERRGRERDDQAAHRWNLTRIVQAVDKFGLIKEDKQLRQGAREFAGEAAHRELKLALSGDLQAPGPPRPAQPSSAQ